MNPHALALAGFVLVSLAVTAILLTPLIVAELHGRVRRYTDSRGGRHGQG